MQTTEPDPIIGVTRSEAIEIAVPVEQVYAFVSDVERLGGLGPECQQNRWVEPGRLFEGTNRIGEHEWTTRCVVVDDEVPRRFAWELPEDVRYARWWYELEPTEHGTRLTHGFEILGRTPMFAGLSAEQLVPRWDYLQQAMATTIAGVKAAIEAGQG